MTTYTKAFFGHRGDPHFDLAKAVEAYEWVLSHPEEADFVVSKMLFDNTAYMMEANRDRIEPVVKAYVSKRLEVAKRGLSRSVSKAAGDMLEVIEAISKAAGDENEGGAGNSTAERQQRVRNQWRDQGGRFRVMNRKIVATEGSKPLDDRDFSSRAGVSSGAVRGLDKSRLAAYQADYLQVVRALSDLQDEVGDEGVTVRAKYANGNTGGTFSLNEALAATKSGHNNHGLVGVDDYKAGNRVERVEAWAHDGLGAAGSRTLGMDALTAMTGSPGFADQVTAWQSHAGSDLQNYLSQQDVRGGDIGTSERTWRRLGASSKLAYDTGGKYLPDQAKYALKVGEWAGTYAPEAEKVIGPTARRAAYRYRGVEKQPDRVYQDDIDALRALAGNGRQAHEWLIKGKPLEQTRAGQREVRQDSATVAALKNLLPDAGLYELNRKSGTIPPSQGIIIDRTGKVVTEAVGYGDDWYLPFNLRNLSKLKGGEYIRTRAYGGLTTEDIYAGLVSGARSVTVVSHSGVYSIEFDDDFRGARRYNDKAARMFARYGQLLDAVKSGDVSLGQQTPARMEELRQQAGLNTGVDPDVDFSDDDFKTEFKRLQAADRKHPTLAEADKNAAIMQALNETVLERDLAPGALEWLHTRVMADDLTEGQADALRQNPIALAERLGMQREARKAVEDADMVNDQNLNPLRLNARGYDRAQEALKQQFPYYIKGVHFSGGTLTGSHDEGYVKPKFNRPEGVNSGYYDNTITGQSKIKGDRTNYQNLGVMGTPGNPIGPNTKPYVEWEHGSNKAKDEEEDLEPSRQADDQQADRAAVKDEQASDRKAVEGMLENRGWLELASFVQAQSVLGPSATKDGVDVGGSPIGSIPWKALGMDPKALGDALAGPQRAQVLSKLKGDLDFLDEHSMFDVPAEVRSRLDNPTPSGVVPAPESTFKLLEGIRAGANYEFKDLGGHVRPRESYTAMIETLLRTNPDFLRHVDPNDEARPLMTPETPMNVVNQFVINEQGRLADELIANYNRQANKHNPAPSMNEKQIRKAALDLAKIRQVYQLRDKAGPGPESEAPKAEAPEAGAEADLTEKLIAAAKPYQDKVRAMAGMGDVADQIDSLVAQAVSARRREAVDLPVDERSMHLVFTGNPGVGKTTVARMIAPLYKELGLTSKADFVEAKPGEIGGPFSNQVRENTQKFLDDHKGGVIFIDEAHQLAQDEYGKQVLETMVPWSYNNRDTVIILAGYPQHMRRFFAHDPGLTSRFPTKFEFKDYKVEDLHRIADTMLSSKGYAVNGPARTALQKKISALPGGEEYANGRSVENLINAATTAQARRLLHTEDPTPAQLETLTVTDIRNAG